MLIKRLALGALVLLVAIGVTACGSQVTDRPETGEPARGASGRPDVSGKRMQEQFLSEISRVAVDGKELEPTWVKTGETGFLRIRGYVVNVSESGVAPMRLDVAVPETVEGVPVTHVLSLQVTDGSRLADDGDDQSLPEALLNGLGDQLLLRYVDVEFTLGEQGPSVVEMAPLQEEFEPDGDSQSPPEYSLPSTSPDAPSAWLRLGETSKSGDSRSAVVTAMIVTQEYAESGGIVSAGLAVRDSAGTATVIHTVSVSAESEDEQKRLAQQLNGDGQSFDLRAAGTTLRP